MSLTPNERILRARLGPHTMHSQGKTNTAPGSAGVHGSFEDEVDPDRVR